MLPGNYKSNDSAVNDCINYNLRTSVKRLHHSRKPRIGFPSAGLLNARQRYLGRGQLSEAALAPVAVPNDIGSRFGSRLRDLRRANQMTQVDMAVMFGIDRSYISEVECGKKGVSLATLEVIALGLGMELSELLKNL